jgi:ubiquinone/menaquinone biosynthesis C-methylase UbiE
MSLSIATTGVRATLTDHAESPFFRGEVEEMLLAAEGRPGQKAVDLGCGNGFLVGLARAQGVETFGFDISRQHVSIARDLSGVDAFLRANVERLPVRSDSVDLVFVQHVIEHLRNPARAVVEWRRVLKPAGRLIVLTPNARYPDPSIFEDATHVQIFDQLSLLDLLGQCGLRIVRSVTLFPYLGGHTVFGLKHQKLFARMPPWAYCGRSLLCSAEKPRG